MSNWQKTAAFPAGTPDVTIVLEGLMALCQRNDNYYFEFACFGKEIGHQLKLRIDNVENKKTDLGQEEILPEGTNVEIRVVNNIQKDAPLVYQSASGDNRDFSHVIDHEANGVLPKKKFDFQNLITVKNGLLHTVAPTVSTFVIQDSQNSQLMGPKPIAFKIGVNIYFDQTQSAELVFSNGRQTIPLIKDGSYKVVKLNNDCNVQYTPTSSDPKQRNDFYKDYEHIIDSSQTQLGETFLILDTPATPPVLPHFAGIMALTGATEALFGGKTDNPCGARAFGFTDNW